MKFIRKYTVGKWENYEERNYKSNKYMNYRSLLEIKEEKNVIIKQEVIREMNKEITEVYQKLDGKKMIQLLGKTL